DESKSVFRIADEQTGATRKGQNATRLPEPIEGQIELVDSIEGNAASLITPGAVDIAVVDARAPSRQVIAEVELGSVHSAKRHLIKRTLHPHVNVVETEGKGDHRVQPTGRHFLHQCRDLASGRGQRLFDEDMDARSGTGERRPKVEMSRCSDKGEVRRGGERLLECRVDGGVTLPG